MLLTITIASLLLAGEPPSQTLTSSSTPVTSPRVMRADTAAQELSLLREILGSRADQQRTSRWAGTIGGLVGGAVALPTGLFLLDRTTDEPLSYAILGIGIGSIAGAGLAFLITPPESALSLAEDLEAREAKGMSPEENVEQTLAAWSEGAASMQKQRQLMMYLLPGVSALMLGSGVGTGVAATHETGRIKNGLLSLSTVFFAAGVVLAVGGLQLALVEIPEEWTYHTYMKLRASVLPPRTTEPGGPKASLGITPVPGGAMVGVGGTF